MFLLALGILCLFVELLDDGVLSIMLSSAECVKAGEITIDIVKYINKIRVDTWLSSLQGNRQIRPRLNSVYMFYPFFTGSNFPSL